MSIDDGFKKMLAGVKLADEGRDEIMGGLEEAWQGYTDLDAKLDGLQQTIATLQALIMEQGEQMKALRAQLNGHAE